MYLKEKQIISSFTRQYLYVYYCFFVHLSKMRTSKRMFYYHNGNYIGTVSQNHAARDNRRLHTPCGEMVMPRA